MPLLIRIILQRTAIFFFGFLSFLGINPDIDIPTEEEVRALEEKQIEEVEKVLSEKTGGGNVPDTVKKVEDRVEEIVKEVAKTQVQTQEVVERTINIPQVQNTGSGLSSKSNPIEDIIVNIVCVNRKVNQISLSTGSGVMVSSSGVVLTNSHVANNFLFNDKNSDSYKNCSIRRENIPTYGFEAELVYLPADWLIENQGFFTEDDPRGSGENDYALLAITKNTNPALSLPASFDYAKLLTSENQIKEGSSVEIAAYPGVHTGVFEVDSNAKLKTADAQVNELATFNGTTIDVISTTPNTVAKRGSSGGGIFYDNSLLGIVTTTDGVGSNTYINAITVPYIIRDFRNDTGDNFESFISRNKNTLINDFESREDYLKSLIADFL